MNDAKFYKEVVGVSDPPLAPGKDSALTSKAQVESSTRPLQPHEHPQAAPLLPDEERGPTMGAAELAAKAIRFRCLQITDVDKARRSALEELDSNLDYSWRAMLATLIEDLEFPSREDRDRLAKSLLQVARELAAIQPKDRDERAEMALGAALRKFGKVAPTEWANELTEFVVEGDESVCQRALVAARVLFSNYDREGHSPPVTLVERIFENTRSRLSQTGALDAEKLGRLGVALCAASAVDPSRLAATLRRILERLPNWQVEFLDEHVAQFRKLGAHNGRDRKEGEDAGETK